MKYVNKEFHLINGEWVHIKTIAQNIRNNEVIAKTYIDGVLKEVAKI